MRLQTFKIFCDIVETGSFSKAAEINEVTQSAVSQQIRAMEEQYNTVFIERGKKNFSLTPEGGLFLKSCKQVLLEMEEFRKKLDNLRNVITGQLTVATVYSIGLHELPPYLKRFRHAFPDVTVKINYRRSTDIYDEVLEGNADIGLVAFPSRRKGIKATLFSRDKMIVICPPDHRLATLKRIRLKQLEDEKFILFDSDLPTRKVIDRLLKNRKINIDVVMEFDSVETVKRTVEIENGISIVPVTTVEAELKAGTLCGIPIEGTDMWRPLGILTNRTRSTSTAQRSFMEILQSDLNKEIGG